MLFVGVHSNGVVNGKMFGTRFDTALKDVGAGVELVEQNSPHESLLFAYAYAYEFLTV